MPQASREAWDSETAYSAFTDDEYGEAYYSAEEYPLPVRRPNPFHPQPPRTLRREVFAKDVEIDRRTPHPLSHRRPDLTTSDRSSGARGNTTIRIRNSNTNIDRPSTLAPGRRRVDPTPEPFPQTQRPQLAHTNDEADMESEEQSPAPLSRPRDGLASQQSRRIPDQRPALDDNKERHVRFEYGGQASRPRRVAEATTGSSGLHRSTPDEVPRPLEPSPPIARPRHGIHPRPHLDLPRTPPISSQIDAPGELYLHVFSYSQDLGIPNQTPDIRTLMTINCRQLVKPTLEVTWSLVCGSAMPWTGKDTKYVDRFLSIPSNQTYLRQKLDEIKSSLRNRQPVHEQVGIYVGDRYGRHRSVAMADRIALEIRHWRPEFNVTCEHLDFEAQAQRNHRRR